VLYFAFRKLTRQPAPVAAAVTPPAGEAETEDEYLARVRRLVTGDKKS
jgi:hypothetical protein